MTTRTRLVLVGLGLLLVLTGCEQLWPLRADIELGSAGTGDAPLTVRFSSAGSTGPVVRRQWDFGDPGSGTANTSEEVSPAHTYWNDGTYLATLRVFSEDGGVSEASQTIVVTNPPPTAMLHVTPGAGAAPLAVTFDLSQSYDPAAIVPTPTGAIVSFVLDFGDGTPPRSGTSVADPIQHTYTTPGVYVPSLVVVDDDGDSASTTRFVRAEGIVTSYPTPGSDPRGLAYDGSFLWLSDAGAKRIYKIRPSDGQSLYAFDAPGEASAPLHVPSEPRAIVPEPLATPGGLAWGDSGLWVACLSDGKIYKVDPNLPRTEPGHVQAVLESAEYTPFALAFGGGSLWVSDLSDGRIYRINPQTGQVVYSFNAPGLAPLRAPSPHDIVLVGPMGLAWQDGLLWIASASRLYKVNPSNGAVIASIAAPGTAPYGLAYDGRYLWNADENGMSVGRLFKLVAP